MPAPGAREAPEFDAENPRTFEKFFDIIDYWFTECGVMDRQEKRKWAVRYADTETTAIWVGEETYNDPTTSFEEFRDALRSTYPGAELTQMWT
ncbi:hypothetical protein BJ138DRAFT_1016542 [Hygrophoropsis aurantiaca]|uniref:Uncharacterized protein n=1 Tax=Hygrophoropsis aurantiaca TaxID=72124 RepID=A0ACB7ZZC7_9AGAM|nr:hypothetical protein BJ138DRAFT_1016542 [Hygrophoropsis aurantiaca]